MQLTSIQSRAVEQILSYYNSSAIVKVDFKSPTGSGKTLMATYFVSSLIDRNPNDQFVFVIATPSSSSLPFFFEQKINLYKKDLPFSKFDVEYIESPSSSKADNTESTPKIFPKINKVYIFGKSTFGKGRIFTERNIIDDFVKIINTKGYHLIYIRDEAHIGGKISSDEETKRFEDLMQNNAHFVINMTATPDYKADTIKVIIKESELNDRRINDDKWLLKTSLIPLLNRDISDDDLLSDAIMQFKEIKNEYIKLESQGVFIRPTMLIQVDNEPSKQPEKKGFFNSIEKIKITLTNNGISWIQYFGDNDKDSNRVYKDKFTLDEITQIDNEIDVVIFKIGPSTGWDIPRACVLLQLRNVSSEILNTQTIGRIKRNPYPNLAKNDITDKYFIYSNAPKIDDDIVIYRYDVKNNLINDELAVIKIINKSQFSRRVSEDKIRKGINEFLTTNKNILIQEIKNLFVVNSKGIDIYKKERLSSNNHILYTEIQNVYIFLKEIDRLKENKSYVFDACKSLIDTFYHIELKGTRLYSDVLLFKEHLYLVLLSKYFKELDNIIKKNCPFIATYKVELLKYDPRQYVQVYDGKVLEADMDDYDTYMFNIKKNDKSSTLQPLDSNPEITVFDKLGKELYRLDDLVKVWCKNLTSSNINGEYIDDSHSFRHSYFDYIIKFSNDAFLYIEVKSENDIDPEKTAMLQRAYADYFAKKELTLFEHPLVISIWKVDENKNINQESFYDRNFIKDDLNTKTYKELINYIAKL